MKQKVLSPSVQDGREAELRPQVPGIGCNREQGLGRRIEEAVEDQSLVGQGERTERARQREDDVHVGCRQQALATGLQPFRLL